MRGVVSARGSVTIPKPLRVRLGIKAGQVLLFEAEGSGFVATIVSTEDAVDAMYGILKVPESTDELVQRMRGTGRRSPMV